MVDSARTDDPHAGQPVLAAGEPLSSARAAMVLIHGRGASAEDILTLAGELIQPGFAYLAPQAAGGTWYPNRFMAPTTVNEPWLSSALASIGRVVAQVSAAGVPPDNLILLGFSQGGCLALEYAARNAQRYGGVAGLSAGLIGADAEPRSDAASLDGTPVFLGCSDRDPHIPARRVETAAETLRRLGADVTVRLYPRMGHAVSRDEIDFVRSMMAVVSGG